MMHKLTTIVLTITVLSGCVASKPNIKPDPAYAPVAPQAPATNPVTNTQTSTGSIYQQATAVSFYEDNKARRVGDILTIVLQEATNASKQAATSTTKDDTVDISAPLIAGRTLNYRGKELSASSDASREFAGEGTSSQSNSLTGRITVTVTEVLSNGNLKVRGEKLMHLNQGDEYIRIKGIVRASDIQADNTIASPLVANAQITYGGNGALAEANSQGWLSRFFSSVLWPF